MQKQKSLFRTITVPDLIIPRVADQIQSERDQSKSRVRYVKKLNEYKIVQPKSRHKK